MKKCILIVIDSLGVGAAPDAKKYGDEEKAILLVMCQK